MPEERSGTVTLAGTDWTWEATPAPRGEDEPDGIEGLAFMEWHDFVFRRKDDPEQEARGRGGIPVAQWSVENVREVLRSCRVRTWRDGEGRLWRVRRSRQAPVARISPKISGDEREASAEEVTFRRLGRDGEEPVRRMAVNLESLAGADDRRLAKILEG